VSAFETSTGLAEWLGSAPTAVKSGCIDNPKLPGRPENAGAYDLMLLLNAEDELIDETGKDACEVIVNVTESAFDTSHLVSFL